MPRPCPTHAAVACAGPGSVATRSDIADGAVGCRRRIGCGRRRARFGAAVGRVGGARRRRGGRRARECLAARHAGPRCARFARSTSGGDTAAGRVFLGAARGARDGAGARRERHARRGRPRLPALRHGVAIAPSGGTRGAELRRIATAAPFTSADDCPHVERDCHGRGGVHDGARGAATAQSPRGVALAPHGARTHHRAGPQGFAANVAPCCPRCARAHPSAHNGATTRLPPSRRAPCCLIHPTDVAPAARARSRTHRRLGYYLLSSVCWRMHGRLSAPRPRRRQPLCHHRRPRWIIKGPSKRVGMARRT